MYHDLMISQPRKSFCKTNSQNYCKLWYVAIHTVGRDLVTLKLIIQRISIAYTIVSLLSDIFYNHLHLLIQL